MPMGDNFVKIKYFRQFRELRPLRARIRNRVRDSAVLVLSAMRKTKTNRGWIAFPYYHHVFDDEIQGFRNHLRFFKNHGDFVSLDDAAAILGGHMKGNYFCLTFDDGYRNLLTNALPLLEERNIPACVFVCVKYAEFDLGKEDDLVSINEIVSKEKKSKYIIEYLSWEDCKVLVKEGLSIGSHTVNHPRLMNLGDAQCLDELRTSKQVIEEKLTGKCDHFACPFGIPNVHFRIEREPVMAKSVGYKTFLTTKRGLNHDHSDPFLVCRDHMQCNWNVGQLRYFFGK
jgi:peptidoglycan/xylan/chitin deacetylase (PgdA/CDA1 family)